MHFPETIPNFWVNPWESQMIKLIRDLYFCFELDLDQIGYSKNYSKKVHKMPRSRTCMKHGTSRRKSGQKRRREREKYERESQQSTDSGISEEERESNTELGAQRVTTADSQNDQSTATDDFSAISPPKKPRMSQEEKNEYLESYISSKNSDFTCFATQNGLFTLIQAIQSHARRCSKNLDLFSPVNNGNEGFSTTLRLNCACGWEKRVNTVGNQHQKTSFDEHLYSASCILGITSTKMDSFLRLMNFGGENYNRNSVGINSKSKRNKKIRQKVHDGIIEYKNSLETSVLNEVEKNFDPQNPPTFKFDGFYDSKNAQLCQGTLLVESNDGSDDKSAGTVVIKRQGNIKDISNGKGIIVNLPSQSLEGVAMQHLLKMVRPKIPKFSLVLDGDVKVSIMNL